MDGERFEESIQHARSFTLRCEVVRADPSTAPATDDAISTATTSTVTRTAANLSRELLRRVAQPVHPGVPVRRRVAVRALPTHRRVIPR